MVTVRSHGSWKRGFDVLDPSGAAIGVFTGSPWREGGRITAGGQEWEFRRRRSRRLVLAGPRGEYAAAERVSVWTGRWRLDSGGRSYELAKASWFSRRFQLRDGDAVVGELGQHGVFGTRTDVTLPPELPRPSRSS